MNIFEALKERIKKIPLLQPNVTSLIQGEKYFGFGLPSNKNTDFTKRSIDIIKLLTNENVLDNIDYIVLPDKEAFEIIKKIENCNDDICNKILLEIAENERIYIEETMKLFGIEKPVKLFSELVNLKKYNKVFHHVKKDIRNQPQILWQAYKTLSEKN